MMQRGCNLGRVVSETVEGFGFDEGRVYEDAWVGGNEL